MKYCRDGESLQFNKAAWRLFYIMIKYHAGSPSLLENGKHLNQFFELISPTMSTVAITNSFFYFSKILNLYENENAKFQNSELKKSVRGSTAEDLKIIEKDIKAFNTVFVKHCVRVHLIYKKLLFNHISGSAFLVRFVLLFSLLFIIIIFIYTYFNIISLMFDLFYFL